MNKLTLMFYVILGILAIFLISIFYSNIYVPARGSVLAVCNQEQFKQEYPTAYVQGSTSYNQSTGNITIMIRETGCEEIDKTIKKHELCHVAQIKRNGGLINCNYTTLKTIEEMECYLAQNYDDRIFSLLYL